MVSARGFALLGCFMLATLAGVLVVDRAAQVFVLLGAAATAAIIAVPFVQSLARWMPRGAAIVIVTLIGMLGTVAVLGAVAWDLNRQASVLSDSLHAAVADLPPGSAAARTASDLQFDRRIDDVFDTAATRLVVGETDPLAVVGQVAKVVVVGVLAAFMVAGGRHIAELMVRFARRVSIRAELHASLAGAVDRSGTYLRRMIAVSVMHGLAAALTARSLGLPGAPSIGAWVTVASTVPILGGALAWFPVVGVATAHDVPIGFAIAVALVWITADRLARAHWAHRPLRVGPLVALIGIGAGFELIGVSGAILGLLVAAFVSAMLSQRGHLAAAITDLIEDPDDRMVPTAETVASESEHVVAEPREDQTYIRLRLSGRTMVTAAVAITGAVAVIEMAVAAQSLIVWFALAGFIAVGHRSADLGDASLVEGAARRRHDDRAGSDGGPGCRSGRARRPIDHQLRNDGASRGARGCPVDGDLALRRPVPREERCTGQGRGVPRLVARPPTHLRCRRAHHRRGRRRRRWPVLDHLLHARNPVGWAEAGVLDARACAGAEASTIPCGWVAPRTRRCRTSLPRPRSSLRSTAPS